MVGLVRGRFQVAIVIIIRHEFHPILCLGEKRKRRCEGKTVWRKEESNGQKEERKGERRQTNSIRAEYKD